MQEEFDKQLRDKIAGAFADMEVAYEPAHWDALQQRMHRRKRKVVALWLARAAMLLLPLGLGWMVWDRSVNDSDISEGTSMSQEIDSLETPTLVEPDRALENSAANREVPTKLPDSRFTDRSAPTGLITQRPEETKPTANKKNSGKISHQPLLSAGKTITPVSSDNAWVPGKAHNQEEKLNTIIDFQSVNCVIEPDRPGVLTRKFQRDIASGSLNLLKEGILLPEEPDRVPEKEVIHPLSVGVALNSQVNYLAAGNSSPSVQPGGGLYAELPIGNRFSLQTGAFVARQNVQSSTPFGNDESVTGDAWFDGQVMNQQAVATLTSIDIPINLRYALWASKTSGFISAGFSSLAYFDEEYTTRTQQMVSINSAEQAEALGVDVPQAEIVTTSAFQSFNAQIDRSVTEDAEPFSRYDWFRMLNFSFAVAYPLNNRLNLLVEPYIQYPLGALGSEDIRLGAGGLSLRVQFNGER